MFTQIKLAQNQTYFRKQIDAHDVHFSFGETLSVAAPATGHRWRPTRQPVVLSEWRKSPPRRNAFTTVMNWTSYKDVAFEGETYGQKDVEFLRFLDLPRKVAPAVLEVGINVGKTRHTPYRMLRDSGWQLADVGAISNGLDSYRNYIESSKGEWSVAKNAYVKGRTGWFSCRSACYLAAGKPVIVQDTGFSSVLPVGDGIVPFDTPEQAADAIREVEGDYPRHAEAARSIAEEWFGSGKVLTGLLDEATSDGG
jgi:hypothetical protein